jgi:hypothetical protein
VQHQPPPAAITIAASWLHIMPRLCAVHAHTGPWWPDMVNHTSLVPPRGSALTVTKLLRKVFPLSNKSSHSHIDMH